MDETKMETENTPEPWRSERSDERGFSFDILDANRHYIAQVLERGNTAETAANACLIAASPALRRILARMVDADECHYDHHDYCQTHSLHERPCPHEEARELLASLPGKAQP